MEPNIQYLSPDNLVFRSYLFYTAILILKMMLMTLLTIRQRFKNNAFCTPEDAVYLKGKMDRTNQNVERVRWCHRNDMENIYIFLIIGFAYIFTNPDPYIAKLLYLIFTLCRIIHTFVYSVVVMPQPARGLSWVIGYIITGYMALKTLLHFLY